MGVGGKLICGQAVKGMGEGVCGVGRRFSSNFSNSITANFKDAEKAKQRSEGKGGGAKGLRCGETGSLYLLAGDCRLLPAKGR